MWRWSWPPTPPAAAPPSVESRSGSWRPRSIHGGGVPVLLFAMRRGRAGARQITIELPDGARVRDALDQLAALAADLPLVMAVNREDAPEDHVLDAGDELALIPPVSGGASSAVVHARVT